MSFWSRLKRSFSKPEPHEEPESEPAAPVQPKRVERAAVAEDELADLRAALSGANVAERRGVANLAAVAGTGREREALDLVLAAAAIQPVGEPLSLAAAELFVQRGQPERALSLLEGLSSPQALMLSADLCAERGEVARAVTLMERVLVRDIDTPGAAERHARWRKWLTGAAPEPAPLDEATVLRGDAPDTSLRIVAEAGRGGAGTVYEAVDDVLGRRVALKVYHRPEGERDKLEREARLAVELSGRGVVRIFDADPARGLIVMEWLAAGALKRWLGRRDREFLWPVQRWFVPLCHAVERVHERGLVHADLKPANVLFRSPDEPVLSDFGLAHPVGERVEGGSRGYLSPERLSGEPAHPADDVYALGRLLEDALSALELDDASERVRRLAEQAMGPLAGRPSGAAAFAQQIAALAPPP